MSGGRLFSRDGKEYQEEGSIKRGRKRCGVIERPERDRTRERERKKETNCMSARRDFFFLKAPLMKWLISKKVRAVNTSSATTDRRNRETEGGSGRKRPEK